MIFQELINNLWSDYNNNNYEFVFHKLREWFNQNEYLSADYFSWFVAVSKSSNIKIDASPFWKHIIIGNKYDIYDNDLYIDIRQEFTESWEKNVYQNHKSAEDFWNIFYDDIYWEKKYPNQKNVSLRIKPLSWDKYLEFIGDIKNAKLNPFYGIVKFYIEDFEEDERFKIGRFTYKSSAQYFARECIVYHIKNSFSKTVEDFIKRNKIEVVEGKWKNEFNLYLKIKKHFNHLSVIHQGSPEFLGEQRFDIWIPKLRVAIEYNGVQHYKPISFFGGVEGLMATKKRDELKRTICKENGVKLIEVKKGYDFKSLISTIENLI